PHARDISRLDFDFLNTRRRRTSTAGLDHRRNGSVIACNQCLDGSVATIAHPADEPEVARSPDGPIAVANALDTTSNAQQRYPHDRSRELDDLLVDPQTVAGFGVQRLDRAIARGAQ